MTSEFTPDDYPMIVKAIQSQIDLTIHELEKLKSNLDTPDLPSGCYITKNLSNGYWEYFALVHKHKIFPKKYAEGTTEKLHLGHSFNPKFRQAHLALAEARRYDIDKECIRALEEHLQGLQANLAEIKSLLDAGEIIKFQKAPKTQEEEKNKLLWCFIDSCLNYYPEDF